MKKTFARLGAGIIATTTVITGTTVVANAEPIAQQQITAELQRQREHAAQRQAEIATQVNGPIISFGPGAKGPYPTLEAAQHAANSIAFFGLNIAQWPVQHPDGTWWFTTRAF